MKPIQFEIDEIPQTGTIDQEGDFKFYFYGSNMTDDDFSEAIETLQKLWDLETDVSLKVHIKLKDIYEDLFDMYNAQGKIEKEDTPLFESLRKDCQWIIDQINALEMNT
jgi:hypothetical protein